VKINLKNLAIFFVLLVASLCASGCYDTDRATAVLRSQGYTNIEIEGYDPWRCDDKDTFSTGFTATNQFGYRVRGTVCSNYLRGAVIRF